MPSLFAATLLPATPACWIGFGLLVVFLLTLDLVVFHRKVHTPTLWESAGWSVFWISLALIFNGLIWWWGFQESGTSEAGLMFFTGYIVEKSLSVDNLFVFVVIFRFFQVPLKYQYRVLFWGVMGAIFLRLAFIMAGVKLLETFSWMLPVFGAFLVFTAFKLVRHTGDDVHPEKNLLLRLARRFLPVTREDHGQKFFARENGLLCVTPMLLVLLVVESSDVLFAVDSVPAILGITDDAFIVFTSNIFAILGLRALYFLLAGVLDRLRYLHIGLAAVLAFIGAKMIFEYVAQQRPDHEMVQPVVSFMHGLWGGHADHPIPTWVSLAAVAGILGLAVAASLLVGRLEKTSKPEA